MFNEVKGRNEVIRDEILNITAVILETPYELIIEKRNVIKTV
jgi:hypothetical protein